MCTLEKRGDLFFLTLTGDCEHRFSPTVINSLISILSQVKSQAVRDSTLITTAHIKFFSNGFDLSWAQAAGSSSDTRELLHHMLESFKPVASVLLSLPMPTIAAINGHVAAAGFLLALNHDYVFMRHNRGVLYMPEVDLGLTFPDYFTAMMLRRIKMGSVENKGFI